MILYKSIYWARGCRNGARRLSFTRRPPAWSYPTPACTPSPFSCTWEHTGSLSLIFAPSPPLARSTLRLGCTSPCSHTLRASAICFPGCTAHRSVPLPFTHGPLACGPPLTRGPFVCRPLACGPPLTRGPFTHGPLACGPPLTHGPLCMALPLRAHLSLLRFQYARKRGGGRAGVVGHGGEVGHGGGAQPGWRGLPVHERGGGTVPCASPACVQRGRRAGEVRCIVNWGAGMAKPGRRGERKGEVRTAPPAPLPAFTQRVGEGVCGG